MKNKYFLLICLTLVISNNIFANVSRSQAQRVRQKIWELNDPDFKNYTIPEKYNNESAVIIAKKEEIYTVGKLKSGYANKTVLNRDRNKKLFYTNFSRYLVKINDKVALDEFGTIEYIENENIKIGYFSSKMTMIVGARIIKPDGSIKEVDIDEAIITSEKGDKDEVHKKLAISDLQIGDILDYFIQEDGNINYMNIPQQYYTFKSKYPVLSHSIHCEIDNKLTTEYHSYNGAPKFTVSTNEQNDIVLDAKKIDNPKQTDNWWISIPREVPFIRLSILFNNNKDIYKPASYRKSGVYENLPIDVILNDAMGWLSIALQYPTREIKKETKKFIARNPKASKKEIAQYIDESLRQQVIFAKRISPYSYVATLFNLFKDFKIENKIAFVTDRYGPRAEDIMDADDFNLMLIANDYSQIFAPPSHRYMIGNTLSECEGETAFLVSTNKLSTNRVLGFDGERSKITLPKSKEDQNVMKINLDIIINEDNLLEIDRTVTLSGHQKNGDYLSLIHRANWYDEKSKWLGTYTIKEDIISKNDQESLNIYNANIQKVEKDIEEETKIEIESYHDIKPKEVKGYKILSFGIAPNDSTFIYNVKYTIDDLVKRAGNNLIFDAGKLISSQITLDEDKRERTANIYRPYEATYSYEINIQIPNGYIAENLDKFNMNVDNESA
ncbi:DUF3857 domain-containing protein, partial [Bacteroidales bacterium OttesenSCG-928-M11]|nr:DUF3857 domain-containing protein [Bacteroidales bacterium OttesenSCG-928-M11]